MLKSLYSSIFTEKNIERLAVVLLIITAVGLPLSACLMSIGTVGLAVLWFVSGHFDYKIENLRKCKYLFPIVWLLIISLIWFINTSDFKYAFHDINIKHVLLVLPIVLGSINLSQKQIFLVLHLFVIATLISSIASFAIYLGIYVPKKPVLNIRDITIIPHIRFGLMCVLSVCITVYYILKKWQSISRSKILLLVLLSLWLIYFTILLQTVTSWFVLFLLFCSYPIIYRKKIKPWLSGIFIFLIIFIVSVVLLFVLKVNSNFHTIKNYDRPLNSTTQLGNAYVHDTTNFMTENGYYIYRFICKKELSSTWDSISSIPYGNTDKLGNPIGATLVRFLTSKGYTKDREGVLLLTSDEVNAIESGCGCCVFVEKPSFYKRVYEIIWEIDRYTKYNDPNGKSICMRIEFLKATFYLIKNNFWFGVGTGDFRKEFKNAYEEMNSPLSKEYRNLAICDQYLTFFVTFGIFGFLASVTCLILPFIMSKRKGFLLISFFILIMTSMISENTLDSQAGALLFVFFYSLFLKLDNNFDMDTNNKKSDPC